MLQIQLEARRDSGNDAPGKTMKIGILSKAEVLDSNMVNMVDLLDACEPITVSPLSSYWQVSTSFLLGVF